MNTRWLSLISLVSLGAVQSAFAKSLVIDAKLHHLRAGDQLEWSDFPAKAEASSLTLHFSSERNPREWTLRLRQQDVKQTWKVLLNDKEFVRLPPDENDMVLCFPVPAGLLLAGENKLVIEPAGKVSDDVRIGEIRLDEHPVADALGEATVEVTVTEVGPEDKPVAVPCRITVLNDCGALMSLGAVSGKGLAVRPGVIYTADGKARFGLPAGD
jgi:hypothetical protein